MAFDKKQYDESTIGSAEELDTYGVWVKSGPQDLTDGLAGVANFDAGLDAEFDTDFEAGAIPFEDDFDENFGNLGVVGLGLTEGIDEESDSFDDTISAHFDQDTEEPPAELLMKIADEITSIRSELNTLKREFADIRSESVPDLEAEAPQSGFFNEDDDEAIALTGDEMNNFLTSADFADEESQDPQRDADEAALKEISAQNESADIGEEIAPLEEPSLEDTAFQETPPEETLPDEDFESPSFDGLSFDESPEAEETPEFTEDLVPLEPLEPIEESEELRDLRLEGAVLETPAPDNSDYLESDPSFSLDEAALAETALDETVTEEAVTEEPVIEEATAEEPSLDEISLDEPAVAEDTLSEDTLSLDTEIGGDSDLTFEDSGFEMNIDDLSTGEEPALEDAASEVAEPALDEADISLDVESAEPALDEMDISLDTESIEIAEPSLDEAELSLDAEAAEPALDDPGLSFDSDSLELSEAVLDDADFSFDTDSLEIPPETAVGEPDLSAAEITEEEITEEPIAEEQITEEQAFDAESLDLSDAVIDEPDLSAADIAEPPLEEPVLDDLSFKDDISLDMDDFGTTDLEAETGTDDSAAADGGQTGIIDDSLAQVIPEGFEINAAEAEVSPDDELEAFAEDELAASAARAESGAPGDLGIPSGLETELKKVLSYMDHLLESLPEDKIEEFAKSEYFDTYKKIFKELGLV